MWRKWYAMWRIWKAFMPMALDVVRDIEMLALRLSVAVLVIYGLWILLRGLVSLHKP
jgi:hypothetical protein